MKCCIIYCIDRYFSAALIDVLFTVLLYMLFTVLTDVFLLC